MPVPVNEKCIVTIQFPEDFKLSAGDLEKVKGSGIFGRERELIVGIDESARTIKVVDECISYAPANTRNELKIVGVKNPIVVK